MVFTIKIPLEVRRFLNRFATEIFIRSVTKYDKSTIAKKREKSVNDFPIAGEETIKTPPQKINTPTFRILIAKPLATNPK